MNFVFLPANFYCKLKLRIILLLILSFCFAVIYSQNFPAKDSLIVHTDSVLLAPENKYFSPEFLLVPGEVMYNGIWDNINIRYQSEILPEKNDTIRLPLIGEYDNCFVLPVSGKVISKFMAPGRRNHKGTDIKLSKGDSVFCAFDGKVRLARTFSGYGQLVLIRHNNGLETIYSHLSKTMVKENQFVDAGTLVGLGGRTGRATTDHLHFESRIYGIPFDSEKYIDFETGQLKGDTLYYISGRIELQLEDFPKQSPKTGTIAGDAIVHKIVKGDTLSALAIKYNTTISRICQDNNILPTKTLRIGEILLIK